MVKSTIELAVGTQRNVHTTLQVKPRSLHLLLGAAVTMYLGAAIVKSTTALAVGTPRNVRANKSPIAALVTRSRVYVMRDRSMRCAINRSSYLKLT